MPFTICVCRTERMPKSNVAKDEKLLMSMYYVGPYAFHYMCLPY